MGNKDVRILPAPKFVSELPSEPKKEVPKLQPPQEVSELQKGVRKMVPRLIQGGKQPPEKKSFAPKEIPAGKYFVGQEIIVPSFMGKVEYRKGKIVTFDKDSDFYTIEMIEGPQKGQKIYRVSQIIEKTNPYGMRKMAA
jgi:hypothetical protein